MLNFHKTIDLNLDLVAKKDFVPRLDVKTTSHEFFVNNYESQYKPTVLTEVTNDWLAKKNWNFHDLASKYRNERFKCGEDNDGYTVKMKMKYFVEYMKTNCDDSPLYIFDGNFGDHPRKKELISDYSVPEYFSEDLFKLVGDSHRPPYRWIVIGSARSGTGIHIDPLGTSAWNSLLVGYKRWCLFNTTTPREAIKLNYVTGGKQFTEAVQWFNTVYPRTQKPSWPDEWAPIEILQRPGETVFVPSGWWHVVMNMTDTIAVTQNYVSTTNFPIVWHKTVRGRPKLSKRWLAQLRIKRPDLADLTQTIDLQNPCGVTSDSSSGSSSSSSSSGSSSCSTCNRESDDSGQESIKKRKKRRNSR